LCICLNKPATILSKYNIHMDHAQSDWVIWRSHQNITFYISNKNLLEFFDTNIFWCTKINTMYILNK
jgi:hypothetical protein